MSAFECCAKINLFLDISGKDASDGYHYIDSVFQEVSLGDTVELDRAPAGASEDTVAFDLSDLTGINDGIRQGLRDSTVHKALRVFREETGVRDRFAVRVLKRIPAGAGLGGGSADAGGVLRRLGELYGTDAAALERAARKVGSDVPFFLYGGLCRVRGKGEIVEPLASRIGMVGLLIVYPGFPVSTGEAYGLVKEYGDCGGIRKFLENKVYNIDFLAKSVYNRFQNFVVEREAALGSILNTVEVKSEVKFSVMSGSGSSLVFGYETEEGARYGENIVNRDGLGQAFVVTPVYRESGGNA